MQDIISWHSDNSFTCFAAEEYRVLENYEVANLDIVPAFVPPGINGVGELAGDGREHRGTCVWLWTDRKLGKDHLGPGPDIQRMKSNYAQSKPRPSTLRQN